MLQITVFGIVAVFLGSLATEQSSGHEILRFQTRIGLFFIDCFADSVQTDRPQVSALSYIPGTIIIMNNKNYKCNNNSDNNNNNYSNTLIKQSFV